MSSAKKGASNYYWFKFDCNKWLIQHGLRSCSIAARGLWTDMLALMHQTTEIEDRGYLLVRESGIAHPLPLQRLAHWANISETECRYLLEELERHGVFHYDERGIIYCAWMVDEETVKRRKAVHGGKGGNPMLKKKTEPTQETLWPSQADGEFAPILPLGASATSDPMDNLDKENKKNGCVPPAQTASSALPLSGNNTPPSLSRNITTVQTREGQTYELPLMRCMAEDGKTIIEIRLTDQDFYALERQYWDVNIAQVFNDYAYWSRGVSASGLHKDVPRAVQNWAKKVRKRTDQLKQETRETMNQKAGWPAQFRTLWDMYPRPEKVVAALRMWQTLHPTGQASHGDFERMRKGLEAWKSSPQWKNPRFVPTLDKFLDEQRWAETPPPFYVIDGRADGERNVPREAPESKNPRSILSTEAPMGGGRTAEDLVALMAERTRQMYS